MRYYDKMFLSPNPGGFDSVPKLGMQIAEVDCYHCGRKTRIPVRPEWVNWEQVAEKYRQGYEKMMLGFDQIIKDVDVMHSGPNPILEHIDNSWKILLADLRKDFEQ